MLQPLSVFVLILNDIVYVLLNDLFSILFPALKLENYYFLKLLVTSLISAIWAKCAMFKHAFI